MYQKTIFFILCCLPSALYSQNCQYLAYDGFDYTLSVPLNALSGGTGWNSPWNVQSDDTSTPGFQISANAGLLSYPGLQALGASMQGGKAYLTAGRRLNTSPTGPFADFVANSDNGIGTQAAGDTLWISALLQKQLNNGQSMYLDFHNSNLNWCNNCSNQHVAMGYFGSQSDVGGQKRWGLRLNDSYFVSNKVVTPGQSAFLVLRLIFNAGNTEVALFVNPTSLGSDGPGAPDVLENAEQNQILRSVAFYPGDAPGNGVADEIRLAKQYACVAPDANVLVDLPPVAVIAANPITGQAPLQVAFNGAASYDPEGTALEYTWDFGDGSAPVQGANATHTYAGFTGLMIATLTVTDNSGLSHSSYQEIQVLNQYNTFSCLPTVTCLSMASCTENNGHLRINTNGNTTFSLVDANGSAVPLMGATDYTNLSAGAYTLLVNGSSGCRDTFSLVIRTDSTTCAGWQPDSCALNIGTNLSGFADWVPERPMRNLMKHVRSEPIPFVESCFCWYLADIVDEIDYLPSGYPTHIPQMTAQGPALLRYVLSSGGANLPPGQSYVLLFDGMGDIVIQGNVSVTNSSAGRVVFTVNDAGNIWLVIRVSALGDPVRNFRLLRSADEFADLNAQPFYSGFLEKIQAFSTLRFMDWGSTNNNPVVEWADRSRTDYFTYGVETGVPYEQMIRLANLTQKDVWICVPHAANAEYITQMATLFRDQLDPNLQIYLEYSNEVWNWIFEQAHYNVATSPPNLNYGRAYAEKARHTFQIWHTVFGAQKNRVKRVIGIQAGFNYLNEQILSHLSPGDWDLGSPTHYIGLDHSSTGNPVLNPGSSPDDIINNARNSFYAFKTSVKQDYRNIQVFGKDIVTYEGGQHFVGNVFGVPYDYQQAMWDAQYSQGIYDLYTELHDSIRNWGCQLAMNFSLASRQESVYGSWGIVDDIDVSQPYITTAPKYQALLDFMCKASPSGTSGLENSSDWTLVPNPNTGFFRIVPPADAGVLLQKTIIDASGRLVWQDQGQGFEIHCPLEAGLYFLHLTSGKKQWVQKMIIQRP